MMSNISDHITVHHKNVIIEKIETEKKYGKFEVPNAVIDDRYLRGVVLACADGLLVKVGDIVRYDTSAGRATSINSVEYLVLQEGDIAFTEND